MESTEIQKKEEMVLDENYEASPTISKEYGIGRKKPFGIARKDAIPKDETSLTNDIQWTQKMVKWALYTHLYVMLVFVPAVILCFSDNSQLVSIGVLLMISWIIMIFIAVPVQVAYVNRRLDVTQDLTRKGLSKSEIKNEIGGLNYHFGRYMNAIYSIFIPIIFLIIIIGAIIWIFVEIFSPHK